MISTFTGIEIGKKGIVTHQAAINVTGHNIANAETEGYSRQKVSLEVFDPLYVPGLTRENGPGQIGQGVQVEKILRARDMLLEDRILSEKNGLEYWKAMSGWLHQAELVHNEPTDRSIMHVLDKFWSSWQELANNPEEMGPREAVLEYGWSLSKHLNHNYQALKAVRNNIEKSIEIRVEEINGLAKQIAHLNGEILRAESVGDNPNDLWDKRDLLVEKLSGMVDVHIGRSDRDEFMVYIGGKHLVQGSHYEGLMLLKNPENEGYSNILWEVDGSPLALRSGELKAMLDARDVEIKGQIDTLDTFAVTLMDLVNSVHRRGFGLNLRTGIDFFAEKTATLNGTGDHDFSGDGRIDGTAIFRMTGTNRLDPDGAVGLAGRVTLENGIAVDYGETDTLSEIMTRLNLAGSGVKATLDPDGRLVVRSDSPSQHISHLEDSGDLLVRFGGLLRNSGEDGAFDSGSGGMGARIAGDFMVMQESHPASWIGINESVSNEPESVAAAAGTDTDGNRMPDLSDGAGSGDNALRIAGIRFHKAMVGGSGTLGEYYSALIARTGLKGETAEGESSNRDLIVENLVNLRKSISGVNIDEELVNLVKFQHGYAAAARFIAEVDKMLDVLINRI